MRSPTPEERLDLALTIAGEIDPRYSPFAGEETRREIAAILSTIENRSILREQTFHDVVHAPSQYSTWDEGKGEATARDHFANHKGYIFRAVDDFFSGRLRSPYPNATHYWSPKAMKQLTGFPDPYWAGDVTDRMRIGPHVFGRDKRISPKALKAVSTARAVAQARRNFDAFGSPSNWPQPPDVHSRRAAISMLNAGILGLDGRTGFTMPVAERFAETPPATLPDTPAAWDAYARSFGEAIARNPKPTRTTRKTRRLPRTPQIDAALPPYAPIPQPRPEPRPQFENVPIPQPRPGDVLPGSLPADPIDTRSVRGRRDASVPPFGAVPSSLLAAPAVGALRVPGRISAPAFSPARDLGRLLGQPAWDGAGLMDMARPDPNATGLYGLQLSALGGPMLDELSPAERMAAIAASPVPRSNLDYRMAAIAADPNLRQAALESNPTYQAPFALGGGTMFGQIGPDGFAGKPQYGGGLAAVWDPDGYAAEQQRLADFERKVKELSVAAPGLPPDRPMPAGPVRPSSIPFDPRLTAAEDRLSAAPSSIAPAAASRFALGPQTVDAGVRTTPKQGRLMVAPAPARFGTPAPQSLRYDFQTDLARLAAMAPELRTAPDQNRFAAAPVPSRFGRPAPDDLRYDYQSDLARLTGMDPEVRTAPELSRPTAAPVPARFGPPAPGELGYDYQTDLARLAAVGPEVRTTPKQDRLMAAPLPARFGMPAPDDLQYDYQTDLARLATGPAPAQTVAAPAAVAPRPVVARPTIAAPRVEPVVQPRRDRFPPAPQQESLLGTLLGPRTGAALLGAAVGGLPGAVLGGLFGSLLGGEPGGLLGGNGRVGPATEAERFNAGSGIRGIEQGMYGPRGATGFSRSNPGSYVTSRGPGQGYDLTSGRYGWREHYDTNGNFRGISYADGRGGLLGGLSRAFGGLFGGGDGGGKSGKGRKSEKDKDDEGAGLW